MNPKQVVEKSAAVGPQAPSQEQKIKTPVWQFKKLSFPAQKVKLPGGVKIEFRLVRTQDRSTASYGLFDTSDEKVASALQAVAASGKQQVVFLGKIER